MTQRRVARGELYLADLSVHGGRLEKNRPVLIVQNDVGNKYSSETIVVPVRHRQGKRMLPVFVPVDRGTGGLARDSFVDAAHLQVLAKSALGRPLGMMPTSVMQAVDRALKVSLGLP